MPEHALSAAANIPDPVVPAWDHLELPKAWPDQLNLGNPRHVWRLVRAMMGKRRRVSLPGDMPGAEILPKYVLQEFHNLPNGNYSKRITKGYISGFDRLMLGHMRRARQRIADHLRECHSVLDIGTAGGRTAATLHEQGIPDVWGIDPSPYLLQHAARRHGAVKFVQGIAEKLPFRDQRFDGVAICFMLHEIPPRQVTLALAEVRRVLKPRGLLAICEPGRAQLEDSSWSLLKREGLAGLYFRWLARRAYEPFVRSWHRIDLELVMRDTGFELRGDEPVFPVRHLFAASR